MANRTKEATVDRNKESTILTDTFYPTVAKNLSNTANANKFFRYVAEYRNRNIDILSNPLPVKFLIFLRDGEDANIIFRTCGIDRKELSLKIKEVRKFLVLDKVASADSDAIDISVALIFMMKYFYKDKAKLRLINMYYAYSIYHLVFKKYWSKFPPIPEVMQYTIDHMNQKYDIVKLGSMEKVLESKMDVIADWMEDKLDPLTDMNIFEIVNSIRTRINDFLKKIANQYHENAAKGNRIFVTNERNAEGEYIIDRENNAGSVSQLSSTYTTKFFANGVSTKACHTAAGICGISENELRTAILQLIKDENVREVKDFYDALFYAFFSYYPDATIADVKTTKFVAAADSIYKKGNSLDKNINRIKELSHIWLKKGSKTYRVTNRAATQNSFRKAIFLYFALVCADNAD